MRQGSWFCKIHLKCHFLQRFIPRHMSTFQSSLSLPKILSPSEIYSKLNEDIIGQHHVKLSLAVGVHNHLIRSFLTKKQVKFQKSKAGLPDDLSFSPH
jgi:ATP-dependent protease Clp ATPase subunit